MLSMSLCWACDSRAFKTSIHNRMAVVCKVTPCSKVKACVHKHHLSICLGVFNGGLHQKCMYKGKYQPKNSRKVIENGYMEVLLLNQPLQV